VADASVQEAHPGLPRSPLYQSRRGVVTNRVFGQVDFRFTDPSFGRDPMRTRGASEWTTWGRIRRPTTRPGPCRE
jgi:hypothetical protein